MTIRSVLESPVSVCTEGTGKDTDIPEDTLHEMLKACCDIHGQEQTSSGLSRILDILYYGIRKDQMKRGEGRDPYLKVLGSGERASEE